MRQQAALERALAGPDDVGDEVLVAVLGEPRADVGVDLRALAGQDEQLLDVAPRGAVEQRQHLLGRVQVRPVRRERAVLAVAAARPRQRERQVAAEGDAPAHRRSLGQLRGPGPRAAGANAWRAHMLGLAMRRRARCSLLSSCSPPRRARRRGASDEAPDQRARRCCWTASPTPSTPASTRRSRAASTARSASTCACACRRTRANAVKLLVSGRADFAILDIHDLALARERGRDLVGVMAIVQQPLAAILARRRSARPRELEGRRVGVGGLPSDDAVLRSIVAGAGGDPATGATRRRSASRRCEACCRPRCGRDGFWNVEGVALRARGPGIARVPRRRLRRARRTPSSC